MFPACKEDADGEGAGADSVARHTAVGMRLGDIGEEDSVDGEGVMLLIRRRRLGFAMIMNDQLTPLTFPTRSLVVYCRLLVWFCTKFLPETWGRL